jgi:hypothetical protein
MKAKWEFLDFRKLSGISKVIQKVKFGDSKQWWLRKRNAECVCGVWTL